MDVHIKNLPTGGIMTEQEIQKQIISYLKLKNCLVFKHNNFGKIRGKFYHNTIGVSDIIGCDKTGKFIAIEVKKIGGKISKEQKEFLETVKRKKGIAILAYSVDDVIDRI